MDKMGCVEGVGLAVKAGMAEEGGEEEGEWDPEAPRYQCCCNSFHITVGRPFLVIAECRVEGPAAGLGGGGRGGGHLPLLLPHRPRRQRLHHRLRRPPAPSALFREGSEYWCSGCRGAS